MTPKQQVLAARTALVLEQPFFGALVLRLDVVEDPACPTAWTDGTAIGYNPAFIAKLSNDEVVAVMAHEVLHCASGHPWRRAGRTSKKFNYAADYAINYVLAEAGFKLPAGCLRDGKYDGKSAEWIYARLPDLPDDDGSGRPGTGGEDVRDPGPATADGNTEADWQQAVQQAAAVATARGSLPASLSRFAKTAAAPKVDWRSVLHRFVQQTASDDYTWRQPNRRYLAGGLYLPSLRSERVGPIAIAIDTSGSVDDVVLAQFSAEVQSVVDDVRPSRVHVIYCDAKVQRIDTFEADDPITLKPKGGGGTAFGPVMDAVDAMDESPVCLVYLTDLDGSHRKTPPSMPVLWAATQVRDVPYGEVVSIE